MQLSVRKIHTLKCPKNTAPANTFALRALKLFGGYLKIAITSSPLFPWYTSTLRPLLELNTPYCETIKEL